MKLQTVSIFVDDQQKARDFYTSTLGFEVTADVPLGEHRWLTVRLGDSADATEVSLEPKAHPAAATFTDALLEDGIPFCVLGVDDVQREHDRLVGAGVTFSQPPTDVGPVIIAVFEDGCGNLLQLAQFKDSAPL
ncbi:VOC family protein [Aeromicrobium sp.]|uniref:VOC family protein n=1 Tax=Aeromicrobium sp. TaxID=1871063 RepID=UPI0028B189AD|nr:VOC family protein [Aeromicrobium sp.]